MSNFRNSDRDTAFLLPPPVNGWLPEKHLARLIVEVIEGLDLSPMQGNRVNASSLSGGEA